MLVAQGIVSGFVESFRECDLTGDLTERTDKAGEVMKDTVWMEPGCVDSGVIKTQTYLCKNVYWGGLM